MSANNAGIGKKDIQSSVSAQGVVDDALYRLLIRSIEAASVDFNASV